MSRKARASGQIREFLGTHKIRVGTAVGLSVAVVLVVAAGAVSSPASIFSSSADAVRGPTGTVKSPAAGVPQPAADDGPSLAPTGWVSTHERVLRHEALPCTGPNEPINFEIFSAGPSVAEAHLAHFVRRCDSSAPADEAPANYTSYVYGHCQIAEGATGCQPPLEIQSFPACQRSLADYTFEGRPLPYKELPSRGGAEVVEIDFLVDHRIEVYTKSTTIVIFASDPTLAKEAIAQLRSQESGGSPTTQASDLQGAPDIVLGPPNAKGIEGDLPCMS